MNAPGTRIVGYCRVSTDDQDNTAQRHAITAEADHRGWAVVAIVEDKASGKTTKHRPAFDAAIAMIEAGQADALVVAKLDRLSRSTVDFGQLLERASSHHWAVVVLDMNLDMTTPNGELIANVLMAFAQFERRIIGQRTKDGLAARRAAGVTLGRPRLLPDRVVTRIQREHDAGRSLNAIARGLEADAIPTAQGGAGWHASTVRAILRRDS